MYSVRKIQSSLNIAFWPILCEAQNLNVKNTLHLLNFKKKKGDGIC